jgi:hypothetical protein
MGILDFFRGSKSARIARRLMAGMRDQGETRRMEFNEQASLIIVFDENGEQVATSFIGNLRHELDREPEESHEGIYQRYLKGFSALGAGEKKSYEQVRPTLRILLKDSSYPAYVELMNRVDHGAKKENPLVWRHVAADVIACCVEESEASLHFTTESDLHDWGVTAAQVLDDAFANVRALPAEYCEATLARFVFANDSFQAARLVCEAPMRTQPLKGSPVAVIPDRDTLFFVGSEDEEGLSALARLNARQLEEANRHISGRPLVLTATGWQEFTPPESSRVEFANVIRRFDAMHWNEYQKFLEKDFAAKDIDIFVASVAIYEDQESGAYVTTVTWTRDVDSIFPVADIVHFHDPLDQSTRYANWKEVVSVMGDTMQEMDNQPRRFHVTGGFPTPEQFLQMGAKRL